jgi:uncharacterized Zn-binding protein involved in type VI secretion
MTNNVYANKNAVAAKAGLGKVIAAFPDVCMSPPAPPAGPVPIPYPNTSFARDLKAGSKTVMVGGKPLALQDQSYYKSSPLGNEAATRSFGASVVTHQITGETYFAAWSMNVKIQGKNVCRHLDLTTSNHACQPGATPPNPNAEGDGYGAAGGRREHVWLLWRPEALAGIADDLRRLLRAERNQTERATHAESDRTPRIC